MPQQTPVNRTPVGAPRPTAPPPINTERSHGSDGAHAAPGTSPGGAGSWMKMLSSTFLGEHSGGLSLGASLFTRRSSSLASSSPSAGTTTRKTKGGLDATPTFKIALVGGPGVGKTSIVRRWLQRPYVSKYSTTIGVDVISIPFRYQNHEVLLHVWDVSSVEVDNTQSGMHSLICDDLDGIFFVFNVHRVSSIAAIDKWRHSLAKYISAKEIPFFLLAHKADMIQRRIMSSDDIASYAKAAGYRGWMWTVGRSNFGENEKHPAVLEALERMVECIWKNWERAPRKVVRPVGVFDPPDGSPIKPMEIIRVDPELHNFSASLIRIPTRAITTVPRDDDLQPIEEKFEKTKRRHSHRISDADTTQDLTRRSSFGGNWILGNEKGVYLRVTEDSVVADHEDSEEEQAEETEEEKNHEDVQEDPYVFPFANQKRIDGKSDDEKEAVDEGSKESSESTQEQEQPAEPEPKAEEAVNKRPPVTVQNDHEAWRFFAGSISRTKAEEILNGREEGSFLLRRKDAQTLILSYVGSTQVHHALIEYKDHKYHVGSAKSSQAAFGSLSRCLRSVRRYAYRGLVFTRNTDFRVVNKEEMALEEDSKSLVQTPVAKLTVSTPASTWRSGGANMTPKTAQRLGMSPTKRSGPRPTSGLLAQQEHVRVPPKARIDELAASFYEQLTQRIKAFAAKPSESPEENSGSLLATDPESMISMVQGELTQLRSMPASEAEAQWRQLVKNMELWNRIVMTLEITEYLEQLP